MEKKEQINIFLKQLRTLSVNEFGNDTNKDIKDMFSTHFAIFCRKCGSGDIYLNFEEGTDYGGYTGYSSGQKIVKCKTCGAAASFWQ